MSKKRISNANTLQADFWTALPIDECRARIVALQQDNDMVLERSYDSSPEAATQFTSFALVRYHHLPYAQRVDKSPGAGVYPLIVDGRLQATSDGTRVTLKIAAETQKRLQFEQVLTRGNTGAFALIMLVLLGTWSRVLPVEIVSGITALCLSAVLFGVWIAMIGLSVSGLGGRYVELTAAAKALIADMRAELKVTSPGR